MRIACSFLRTLLFLLLQTNLAIAVLSSNPGDFNVVICGDKKGKTPECTPSISNREAQFVQRWGYRLRLFLRRRNQGPPRQAYQWESDPKVYSVGSDIPGYTSMGKLAWDMDWDENGSSGLIGSYSSMDRSTIGSGGWWAGSSNTEMTAGQSDYPDSIHAEMDGGDDLYYPSSGYSVEDAAHRQQRIMERTMGESYGASTSTDIRENNQTDLDVLAENPRVGPYSDRRRSRLRMGERYLPLARRHIISST